MSYTPQTWEDLPSTNTPITASRLNHIESGISANDTAISNLEGLIEYSNNFLKIGEVGIAWGSFNTAISSNSKTIKSITLPTTFSNTDYSVSVTSNSDYAYNTEMSYLTQNKTTGSFEIGIWNASNNTTTADIQYIVVGEV